LWDTVNRMMFAFKVNLNVYYAPPVGKGAISVDFVRPSIAYIANNSRTQRPSVPKFGMESSPP